MANDPRGGVETVMREILETLKGIDTSLKKIVVFQDQIRKAVVNAPADRRTA